MRRTAEETTAQQILGQIGTMKLNNSDVIDADGCQRYRMTLLNDIQKNGNCKLRRALSADK